MTRLVRVANAGVKVAGFSVICGEFVRVAGKGLSGGGAEANESGGRGKVGRGRIIENGSMDLDYCQGNSTIIYHSNVRRGSGVDGRSWREFGSLVRQVTFRLVPVPPPAVSRYPIGG